MLSLNHELTRRSALRLASAAGLAAFAAPRFVAAQDMSADDLPEMVITAVEYSFDLPAEVNAGWTRVTLDNQGTMDHHAMLLKVHEGGSVDDLLAVLQTPDFGAIFPLAGPVGGPLVGPGLSSTVIIDLQPGDYVAICVIPDDDGTPHYVLGQQAAFTVVGEAAMADAPTADQTISLIEMAFEGLPTELPAGPQVWEVRNDGAQLHEMAVVHLAEGVTGDMVLAIFGLAATPEGEMSHDMESSPASESMEMMGPPFVAIGGVAPMAPGNTNYLTADLAAGNYMALCFVPDSETGAPHVMMGMIAEFTVS